MSQSDRLRVVFMGTAEFAVPSLRRLATVSDVRAVVTQPDRPSGRGRTTSPPPIKPVAQELGLDLHQPERVRSASFVRNLRGLSPDVIVVVAYGQLLRRPLLELPPFGCVNVHPSLLPKYRGAAPVPWAIWNGDSDTGVTVMQLDEGEDSGPILRQTRVDVDPEENAAHLSERLAVLGSELLVELLADLRAGIVEPRPQDHEHATRAPRLARQMAEVDWTLPARTIYDHYRACVPWPGTTASWPDGSQLRIVACRPTAEPCVGEPGALLISQRRLMVETGDCRLELLKVQPANRAAVTAEAYLNGLRGVVPAAFRALPGTAQDTNG